MYGSRRYDFQQQDNACVSAAGYYGDRSWQWTTDAYETLRPVAAGDTTTLSSLVQDYLTARFEAIRNGEAPRLGTRSLASTIERKIGEILAESEDVNSDAQTITGSLHSSLLRELVAEGSIPYPTFRMLLANNSELASSQDIDEFVVKNDRFIQTKVESNDSQKYLVTMEDFATIFGAQPAENGWLVTILRKIRN